MGSIVTGDLAHELVVHALRVPLAVGGGDLGDRSGDGVERHLLHAGEALAEVLDDPGHSDVATGAVPDHPGLGARLGGEVGDERRNPLRSQLISRDAEGSEQLLRHRRVGHRHDGVDAHACLPTFVSQRPGEADHTHLGAAVVGLAEVAVQAGIRRGVDDARTRLLPQDRPRSTGDELRTEQVDLDDALDVGVRHVVERTVQRDAGVVDHDVETPERVHGRGDHVSHESGIRHRASEREGVTSSCLDLGDDRFGVSELEVVDGNQSTELGHVQSV